MNVFTRGARAAFRNPVRSGAMVIMLAASLGLLLAMLAAYASITAKINEVKASTATQISINPAGVMGGLGGGDFLTNEQVATIASTPHIKSFSASLRDQLGNDETNLTPSFELGNVGKRQMRFESRDDTPTSKAPAIQEFKPRTTIMGTTNPEGTTSKGSLEGETFDGGSSDLVAMVNTLRPKITYQ